MTLHNPSSIELCKSCGKEFYRTTNHQIFCSRDCTKEWWRNNYKYSAVYKKRFDILKRDNFRCIYCGKSSVEDDVKLEVDHITPVKGKSNRQPIEEYKDDELVTSCRRCNQGKRTTKLTDEQVIRIKLVILGRKRPPR